MKRSVPCLTIYTISHVSARFEMYALASLGLARSYGLNNDLYPRKGYQELQRIHPEFLNGYVFVVVVNESTCLSWTSFAQWYTCSLPKARDAVENTILLDLSDLIHSVMWREAMHIRFFTWSSNISTAAVSPASRLHIFNRYWPRRPIPSSKPRLPKALPL